jgi:hypothetical protein
LIGVVALVALNLVEQAGIGKVKEISISGIGFQPADFPLKCGHGVS